MPLLTINDVLVTNLPSCRDSRGDLTEIFRCSFAPDHHFIQSNFVRSKAGVLRGVHVHNQHTDYLVILEGRATIGMRDLRIKSETYGQTLSITVTGEDITSLVIPPGVAHGFYFHEPSLHLYQVDRYWDPKDELGCFWADPELGIVWPESEVLLSERDANLPTLNELLEQLRT